MVETKHDFQGVLSARDRLCLRNNLTMIGMTMTTKNKFLLVLATSLLLSACGSGVEEKSKASKQDEAAMESKTEQSTVEPLAAKQETNDQEATKLVAKRVKAAEELNDNKMINLNDGMIEWQQGRVQFLNLEGGFYGIITDSGNKILPLNLAKEFAQNGAVVRIKGKVKNVLTIQQWGTPFTITEIELITPGNNQNENEM